MDKKLKAKWIKALRGGKIKQARGKLINEKGAMCCIGVLGSICGMSKTFMADNAGAIRGTGFERIDAALSEQDVDRLVDMNDGNPRKGITKKSFLKIADYIEANL